MAKKGASLHGPPALAAWPAPRAGVWTGRSIVRMPAARLHCISAASSMACMSSDEFSGWMPRPFEFVAQPAWVITIGFSG